MRGILTGVCVGLWSASLALAQSTTTTVVSTSSSTIAPSTSTSTTTATSTSLACQVGSYDPRECARVEDSKEECRETCCTNDFDCLSDACNADGACDDAAWDHFQEQWVTAGEFYKFCQNPDDPNVDFEVSEIATKFGEFNVDDSCRQYAFGCKRAARKHVLQCADAGRCVTCCRTVLTRWRAKEVRRVKAQGGGAACQKAIKCLRRATRKGEACRNACRRRPTCGEPALRACLERSPKGGQILECYGKCTEKCENADSYRWCLQACQGLDDCEPFDECTDSLGSGGAAGCLAKEPSECVPITTTSTTTSSTTSSTSQSTTSTSSSTSTSSPLLVGPRLR